VSSASPAGECESPNLHSEQSTTDIPHHRILNKVARSMRINSRLNERELAAPHKRRGYTSVNKRVNSAERGRSGDCKGLGWTSLLQRTTARVPSRHLTQSTLNTAFRSACSLESGWVGGRRSRQLVASVDQTQGKPC